MFPRWCVCCDCTCFIVSLKHLCKQNLIWTRNKNTRGVVFFSLCFDFFPPCFLKIRMDMQAVLLVSLKKKNPKRLYSSDLAELDKSLCSVKTPLRVWKSPSTQYIPFQSTRCSSLCLTLIKHNHQAIRACVCMCVWRAHTDTHTHTKSVSPSIFSVQVELTTPGSWRLN